MRTVMIENGSNMVAYNIFDCENCGKEVGESHPRELIEGKVYCGDCAFVCGFIDEKKYLKKYRYFVSYGGERAVVRNGEILIAIGKFPWERTTRDRSCREYKQWRIQVFERDFYSCQECGKVGGTLNAHHIKPYKDYQELRYSVDNGITLCEGCHRKVHKKMKKH